MKSKKNKIMNLQKESNDQEIKGKSARFNH